MKTDLLYSNISTRPLHKVTTTTVHHIVLNNSHNLYIEKGSEILDAWRVHEVGNNTHPKHHLNYHNFLVLFAYLRTKL